MEDKIKFLQEILRNLPEYDLEFCSYPAGGGCSGYGEVYNSYTLSNPQIITLLKERIDNTELFQGLATEEIPEREIEEMASDACFPDYSVDVWELPYDLEEIAELFGAVPEDFDPLDEEEEKDDETCHDFVRRFNAIKDDEYFFHYNASDEEYEADVFLKADQARGLILHYLKEENYRDDEIVIPEGLSKWIPFTFKDAGKIIAKQEDSPSVHSGWETAVEDDEFLQEVADIVTEYLEDIISEEEVLERIEDLK